MPEALEAGTLNGHGIAGLGAAISFINRVGIQKIREKEEELMHIFYEGIRDIPGITVYGDFSSLNRCPIVSFNLGNVDSAVLADELYDKYGICVRAGGHCAPLMHRALGTEKQGAVRFSFSCFNTPWEIRSAVSAVREIAEIWL
jgi:selenocysteine lyase/cysteine desulfurase